VVSAGSPNQLCDRNDLAGEGALQLLGSGAGRKPQVATHGVQAEAVVVAPMPAVGRGPR
jgi:hypothetical protein